MVSVIKAHFSNLTQTKSGQKKNNKFTPKQLSVLVDIYPKEAGAAKAKKNAIDDRAMASLIFD